MTSYALIRFSFLAVEIFFTEDDFRANEPDLRMPVVVTKNSRIATPIVLDVIPLTVSEARHRISQNCLLENIPENPFSPPFAGNYILVITHTTECCIYTLRFEGLQQYSDQNHLCP